MATAKVLFKQQCPGCEEMVPIKNAALIGKKTDCPNCGFRFVVEKPERAGDDDGPAKKLGIIKGKPAPKAAAKSEAKSDAKEKEKDKSAKGKKSKKKEGGNNTLTILLVVLGLALVGGGAWFFFFRGDGDPTPIGGNPGGGNPGGGGNNGNAGGNGNDGGEGGGNPGPKTPPINDSGVNITNLLPNESQAVLYANLKAQETPDFFKSSLYTSLFDTPGAFDPKDFEARFGFAPRSLAEVVVAVNKTRNWTFSVVKTASAINREELTRRLKLATSETVGDFNMHKVQGDLDPFGVALFQGLQPRPMAVHVYDDRTLVMADVDQLKQFLQDKRQPKYLTRPPEPETTTPPPMGGNGAMGGAMGMSGQAMGFAGGGGQSTPPIGFAGNAGAIDVPGGNDGGGSRSGGEMGFQPVGTGSGMGGGVGGDPMGGQPPPPAKPKVTGSFLTINPALKRLLDAVDNPRQMILFAFDRKLGMDAAIKALTDKAKEEKEGEAKDPFGDIVTLQERDGAIGVRYFTEDRMAVTLAEEFSSANEARRSELLFRQIAGGLVVPAVNLRFRMNIQLVGGAPPMGNAGQFGAMGAEGGMVGNVGMFGATGTGGVPPIGSGAGGKFGGGFPGPGPIGSGATGQFGGQPMGQFGQMGGEPGGDDNHATGSRLESRAHEKIHLITIDLRFGDDGTIYDAIKVLLSQSSITIKTEAMIVNHRSHVGELAAALSTYVKAKGQFPRGTADREAGRGRVLPYGPSQRIAWTAEMLQYFGPAYAGMEIDASRSWNEMPNLAAASTAVPYFVAADNPRGSYPPAVWRHPIPAKNATVITSHYVGVAGLGLDAAEYKKGDKAVEAKLGVFGYDRATKVTDITDGPDKTIAVIQVPPAFRTCWLAGGGSTVRGVPEDGGVESFVCTEYKGQKGTVAIMADGKVRFIPSSIPAETFRALCTIAAGDKVEDIDTLCPVMEGSEVVLKPAPLPVEPKPVDPKPVDPKPGDNKVKVPNGWQEVYIEKLNISLWMPGKPFIEKTAAELGRFHPTLDAEGGYYSAMVEKGDANLSLDGFKKAVEERDEVPAKPVTIAGWQGFITETNKAGLGKEITFYTRTKDATYIEMNLKPKGNTDPMVFFQTLRVGRSTASQEVDPPKPPVDPKPAEKPPLPTGWKEYNLGTGFALAFPGNPTRGQETVEDLGNNFGKAKLSGYFLRTQNGGYAVDCYVFQEEIKPFFRQAFHVLFRRIFIEKEQKGTNVSEGVNLTLDGHPGEEVEFTDASGNRIRMRGYLVANKVYFRVMVAGVDKMPAKDVKTYFDSVRLTKPGEKPTSGGSPPVDPKPVDPPPKGGATSADIPKATKLDHLKQIGLAYHNHFDSANGVGPASVEKLAPLVENNPKILTPIKEGKYVVYWNVRLFSMTAGTSNTVLAYESDVPTRGGLVLMGDGSVKQMTVQDFQKAPKAGR